MAKIMVVDDSSLVRKKCSRILSENGYQVIEAENGIEALQKYRQHKPDGVLMDLVMPGMHGITALHELKKIDPVARVAILTAMGHKDMVTSAIKEGAKDFIVKPFREGRVLDTIQRLLGNTQLDPF
jgi:two-component system chemotaxis response regulator CheY